MDLYLLRHAQAAPGSPDSERPLTNAGIAELDRVLDAAQRTGTLPTVVLSSPYRRARQTAERAVTRLGFAREIVLCGGLTPDNRPEALWDEVRPWTAEAGVLVVTHEPLVSSAASWLLGSSRVAVRYPTAGLMKLRMLSTGSAPTAALEWLLTPECV